MSNGEPIEPEVITKPESPFYRSPKFLAVLAVPIIIGTIFLSFKYLPILRLSKQEQPQQVSEMKTLKSAVGVIQSLDSTKRMVLVMDEFTNQQIAVFVNGKATITEEGPLKALLSEMPEEIVSLPKEAKILKADTKNVDFSQLKIGMRVQINAEVDDTNSWQAKNINIPFI